MSNSSFLPIDRTLTGATTPGQSGPGSDNNKWVFCFLQCITRASLSECLVSYPGYSLEVSYLSAEMKTVYSTVSVDWVTPLGKGKLWIQRSCTLLKKLTLLPIQLVVDELGKYIGIFTETIADTDRGLRDVMVKVFDFGFEVSEFKLQSLLSSFSH